VPREGRVNDTYADDYAASEILSKAKLAALMSVLERAHYNFTRTPDMAYMSVYEVMEHWRTVSNAWDYVNREMWRVK
jgi:hypothetical protein